MSKDIKIDKVSSPFPGVDKWHRDNQAPGNAPANSPAAPGNAPGGNSGKSK